MVEENNMATTYSNPKEMLGYIVVKFIDQQLPLLQNIPYDRRAVFAFYYQLKGLDSQLISFRDDMSLSLMSPDAEQEDTEIDYRTAMREINEILKENWKNVYAKDYEDFMGGLYRWAELIASCYPKLGLVPESDTNIDDKRENLINVNPKAMAEEDEIPYAGNETKDWEAEANEPDPNRLTKEQFEEFNARPKQQPRNIDPRTRENNREIEPEREPEPVVAQPDPEELQRERDRQNRRQAYRLI